MNSALHWFPEQEKQGILGRDIFAEKRGTVSI